MCAWQRHPVGAERTAAFYQPDGRDAAGLPADASTAMLPEQPGAAPGGGHSGCRRGRHNVLIGLFGTDGVNDGNPTQRRHS